MKRDLSKMTCIEDLRRVAKRKMPRMFYDYIDSGSWTETTYRENTSDFKDIRFRQKVLVNMEGRSLETKMIGGGCENAGGDCADGFYRHGTRRR